MSKPKVLAINLPQFHPFQENNTWWGKGFTEWTNVAKAKPLFEGHYQPQFPTDLGFYDLRLAESRQAQAELAKEYNIDGFCYYHYWFSGKRLMNEPIDEILKLKQPDFPFCYFWANESWSRRWVGEERDVLISQKYSPEDDLAHAEWLVESFKDDRYIKINNRPVFIIYKPFDLPDTRKTFAIFEAVCIKNGIKKPYFIASNSHDHTKNPYLLGFDHVLNFSPRLGVLAEFLNDKASYQKLKSNVKLGVYNAKLKLYNYATYLSQIKKLHFDYKGLPCVLVGYDNTARRGKNAVIMVNQNVEDFKLALEEAKEQVSQYPEEEQIIFINAWNEWAEGNHLEPCRKFGRQFLEAVKEVFN
jgi:lipopolysaccharide biosynthesis protein